MAVATRTRDDIDRQRRIDSRYPATQDVLAARMVAVFNAQEAALRREEGARSALRQSLIDLSAIAEGLAAEMEPPEATAGR